MDKKTNNEVAGGGGGEAKNSHRSRCKCKFMKRAKFVVGFGAFFLFCVCVHSKRTPQNNIEIKSRSEYDEKKTVLAGRRAA